MSGLATNSSSSPASSGSSGVGGIGRPSRMIATSAVSCGQSTSPTRLATTGESAGRGSSSMSGFDCWEGKIRTRSPTLTAPSTQAGIRRGIEPATSTPQASSNIHSFLGLLTRATVRGTPYSVFASRDTTRFTLSSPVAATTTWHSCSPASSSEVTSQASASSHCASGTEARLMAAGSLSTSRTSCPFSSSSRATERPTLPAPAMATRISVLLAGPVAQGGLDRVRVTVSHHDVHEVAVLEHSVLAGQQPLAEPGEERDPGPRGLLQPAHPLADPGVVNMPLGQPHRATGVTPLRLRAVRQQPAQHLVGRPSDCGHRGDAEPLVDLGPARVVDPGHHVVDAERLAGHPGRDDVGVVAAADGGERLRLLDPGLAQGVPVEADAGDAATGEPGTQPPEGRLVRVDHRHRVPLALQDQRQSRPHPAAAHDDEVHPRSSPVTGSPG